MRLKLWLLFPLGWVPTAKCLYSVSWCMQTLQYFQHTCNSTDEGPGTKHLERNSNHKMEQFLFIVLCLTFSYLLSKVPQSLLEFFSVICLIILAFHPECCWVKVKPKSAINTPKWENNDPCPFYIGVFSSPGLAHLIHPSTELKLQGGSLLVHVVYRKWPNKMLLMPTSN